VKASAAATRLGVWMFNLHAANGSATMRAARAIAHEEAARLSRPAPLVIAVTVLALVALDRAYGLERLLVGRSGDGR